jgi:transposase-like protein
MKLYRTWKEKQSIVNEAYSIVLNIRPTALKYDVQPSQIRRWKKRLDLLLNQSQMTDEKQKHLFTLKSTQTGRPRLEREVYASMKLYYENLRNMDRVVTVEMLCFEFIRLSGNNDITMTALRKRIQRWLKTEKIVQRRITNVAQNIHYDGDRVNGFVQYVNEQIVCGSYPKSHIVSIDETNIYFDMVGSTTLANRGSRTVSIKSSGTSARCSIILGVTMDGQKLPPFIIFKGKVNGRIRREWTGNTEYPSSSFYAVQEHAWVDRDVFIQWINKVWKPFCEQKNSTYLMMDEFSVHLMQECVDPIRECGTEIDFILGGYTSKLQILDVGVNKPFKGYVKKSYERFMVGNTERRKVTRLDVAKWVEEAWNQVTVETICNTWSSIGYVNTN